MTLAPGTIDLHALHVHVHVPLWYIGVYTHTLYFLPPRVYVLNVVSMILHVPVIDMLLVGIDLSDFLWFKNWYNYMYIGVHVVGQGLPWHLVMLERPKNSFHARWVHVFWLELYLHVHVYRSWVAMVYWYQLGHTCTCKWHLIIGPSFPIWVLGILCNVEIWPHPHLWWSSAPGLGHSEFTHVMYVVHISWAVCV